MAVHSRGVGHRERLWCYCAGYEPRPPTRPTDEEEEEDSRLSNLTPTTISLASTDCNWNRCGLQESEVRGWEGLSPGEKVGSESCWFVEAIVGGGAEWFRGGGGGGGVEATQRRGGPAAGHQLLTDPFTKLPCKPLMLMWRTDKHKKTEKLKY